MSRLTTREKLKARLVALGFMTESEEIVRFYPGHIQRSAGAFVWGVRPSLLGSPDSMADCLKSKKLERSDNGAIYADFDTVTITAPEGQGESRE